MDALILGYLGCQFPLVDSGLTVSWNLVTDALVSLDFPAMLGMMNGAESMPRLQGYIYHLITWYCLLFILNAILGMGKKICVLQEPLGLGVQPGTTGESILKIWGR